MVVADETGVGGEITVPATVNEFGEDEDFRFGTRMGCAPETAAAGFGFRAAEAAELVKELGRDGLTGVVADGAVTADRIFVALDAHRQRSPVRVERGQRVAGDGGCRATR